MRVHTKPSRSSISCIQVHSRHRDTVTTFPPRRMGLLNRPRHRNLSKARISARNLCTRLVVRGNDISMSRSTLRRCHNLTITSLKILNTMRSLTGNILSNIISIILTPSPSPRLSPSNTIARNSLVIISMIHTSHHHPSALQILTHLVTTTQDPPNHIGNLHSSRIRRRKALRIISPRTMKISTKCPSNPQLLQNTHRFPICKRRGSHSMFTSARRVGRRRTPLVRICTSSVFI